MRATLNTGLAAIVGARTIVGADPVEFAETFVRNYEGAQWFDKQRRRLIEAVDRAEQDGQP